MQTFSGRRLGILLLAFAVFAGACSSDDDDAAPTDSGESTTTTEAPEPETGGTLVAAISSDPGALNPAVTTSGATHSASELMFNGLVELDENGEPVPELASSWEIEEEGALYRFTLADGIEWHDGTPFTSADVKFSFDEVLLQFHSRTSASVGGALESIETPDDMTVEFRFSEPYAPLLQQLNVTEAPIIPKHIYEGSDPQENPANLEPIGTGPYKFVSYTPDSEIRLERNENYFKTDLPVLDEVVLRIIPDDANALASLEAGEVDFIFGVPGPDLERLRGDDAYSFLETSVNPGGSNCIMTVSFNLDRPIFQDVRTRRAIGTALDRDAFLERVLFGQGRVAEAPISSNIPFGHADGIDLPEFDVDAAAALLDEAGWVQEGDGTRTASGVEGVDDGTPLAFDFLAFPTFQQYGELLRAQLSEVGADVTLRPLETPVFVETVFTDRDFDTNIISFCNGPDPEIGVRRMYISSNIQPIPFSNSSAYSNADVDRLFDEALTTVDTEARSDVYRQIQEQLAEDLPYLWIVETESTRAFTADCEGFSESGHFAETASCSR
ncbi:MAG: ABC transporter substrate-binding protein [Acidimicrobiales bacterium]|nr:ABC transporter substrate-binding protein [Acidimicrobiales bacterium]